MPQREVPNNIVLSIITITYRDPAGLVKTVNSLRPLLQSDIHWEHIVIDSSPELNQECLRNLPRDWPFVHATTDPSGVYAAQNLGLSKANGKYLWFLNGGDEMRNLETAETVISATETYPEVDIFFGNAELVEQGKPLYTVAPKPAFKLNLVGDNQICHQAVIYRKSLFERTGPFSTELKVASDYEHHWKCVLLGLKAKKIDEVLCRFDMGGASNGITAFREFKLIQRKLSGEMSAQTNLLNAIAWNYRYLRFCIIKKISGTALGLRIRSFFHSWKRGNF